MIQTGQIIFYDSSKMMCFDVTHFMVKKPEKQMIETTFLGDEERHFIQLTPEPICMFIETGEEIVKLDPSPIFDSALIFPPIRSTITLLIESPSPPPCEKLSDL